MATTVTKATPVLPEAAVLPLLEQARQAARSVLPESSLSLELEKAFDALLRQWRRVLDHLDRQRNPPAPLPPTVRLPGSKY